MKKSPYQKMQDELREERMKQERSRQRDEAKLQKARAALFAKQQELEELQRKMQQIKRHLDTEIDLSLKSTDTVGMVRQRFHDAFGSELSLYKGRSLANDGEILSTICSDGKKDNILHCKGTMPVTEFEDRMKKIGYRAIVKFEKGGNRDQRNIVGVNLATKFVD